MKRFFSFVLPFLLIGCTAAQLDTTAAIADPLVNVALSGLAQSYGVPVTLTAPTVTILQNQFWGMLKQKYAQQPIAAGASIPAIGVPVAAQNPTASELLTALSKLGDPAAQSLVPPQKINLWNHKAFRYGN